MNREEQILDYLDSRIEARTVDVLTHLNTINTYKVSYPTVKDTLSLMYRKNKLRKDAYGLFRTFDRTVTPEAYVGTVLKLDINYDDLALIVSEEFGITSQELQSKKRHREIVDARKAFFYFAIKIRDTRRLSDSLKKIGKMMDRDHATVIHCNNSAKDLIEHDNEFRTKIELIESRVRQDVFKHSSVYDDSTAIGYYFDKPEQLSKHCDR
jgi:hypothetical protein